MRIQDLNAEWSKLKSVFEAEELQRILQVQMGNEGLPVLQGSDEESGKISFVAGLISVLTHSYTPLGIRQWFYRPRAPLGGTSPIVLLTGPWHPEDDRASAVMELARTTLL